LPLTGRDGFKLLLECKKGVFVAKRFYRRILTKNKRRFDYG